MGNKPLGGEDYNANILLGSPDQQQLKVEANNLKHLSKDEPTYWQSDNNKIRT